MTIPNLSNSSASGSGTGDQTQAGSFYGGNLNVTPPRRESYFMYGLLVLAGLYIWKKG